MNYGRRHGFIREVNLPTLSYYINVDKNVDGI
jgi:hypothetical protein